MPPKNKINLKERLEDGELDLSLSNLQEVPVREIAAIKKATSLDLSNNNIASLGKNFIILTNIVKLDLSKNSLTELPENFGELTQLKHLDLYSNKLTHLPLSFHQLKSLRWLDLKNNPLVPAVAQVAGPCLDSQQCIQCAKNVVTLFTQMYEQVEQEKARLELQRQAELEAQAAHSRQLLKKKERKKAAKAKKTKLKNEKNLEIINSVEEFDYFYDNVEPPVRAEKKPKNKSKKSNLIFSLIKYTFWLSIFTAITVFIFTSSKVDSAISMKQNIISVWSDFLTALPPNWRSWAQHFGLYVESLHSMTGKLVENAVILIENIRRDERVNATMQTIWDTVLIAAKEVKKLCYMLGDQAIVLTNEIKKKII